MTRSKWIATGLALPTALGLALGCGGGGDTSGDATVTLPSPVAAASGTAAPAAGAPAAAAPAADTSKDTGAAPAVKAEGFGTLKGRVVFAGDPPAPKVLVPKGDTSVKDAAVCAVNPILDQSLVVDPETKGVANAIVYVPRPTAVKPEAESAAQSAVVEFDQKGCVFQPHVIVVMKGATINVKSDDPVGHNVNAQLINTKFNSTIPANSKTPIPIVPKAAETGPGRVVCDIHNWMTSWWYVANNPYFAVTDAKGNFEIKDVPAGTQKVVVWAESVAPRGYLTPPTGEAVNIAPDGETTKEFTIQASQIRK